MSTVADIVVGNSHVVYFGKIVNTWAIHWVNYLTTYLFLISSNQESAFTDRNGLLTVK